MLDSSSMTVFAEKIEPEKSLLADDHLSIPGVMFALWIGVTRLSAESIIAMRKQTSTKSALPMNCKRDGSVFAEP